MADKNQLETSNLLKLFPTEIWLPVLNLVTNYQDYLRVRGSASFLNNTLKPLTTRVLFRKVLYVLARQKKIHIGTTDFSDLLQLRLVFRPWKDSVDKILNGLSVSSASSTCPLNRSEDFDKYKVDFFGNPFLGRSVEIILFPDNFTDKTRYYQGLMEMLRRFGHHVLYCRLIFLIRDAAETKRFFEILKRIFESMPNLRRLHFWSIAETPSELPEHILPKLRHLQTISQCGMPFVVFQSLVRKNQQISSLTLMGNKSGKELQICLEQLPNLQDLEVDMIQPNALREAQVVCGLKSLQLKLRQTEIPTCGIIFSTLQDKFGKTLKTLWLELPDAGLYIEGVTLRLPHLQALTLVVQKLENLDFILPLKDTLKTLTIFAREYEAHTNLQFKKIKFFKHQNSSTIRNSKIWDVFEKLQVMQLGTYIGYKINYVFTRSSQNRISITNFTECSCGATLLNACLVSNILAFLVMLCVLAIYCFLIYWLVNMASASFDEPI